MKQICETSNTNIAAERRTGNSKNLKVVNNELDTRVNSTLEETQIPFMASSFPLSV